jgi:hypothetical protein
MLKELNNADITVFRISEAYNYFTKLILWKAGRLHFVASLEMTKIQTDNRLQRPPQSTQGPSSLIEEYYRS